MVSTWYKLVLPRFKEKRHRSLLCCSGECQNIWKYANQQNPLLDSNYTIPPKCKRYFLFLKSSRRSPQFDTRFRFEVLFLLQMTFLKLFPSAELPRFSSPQSEDMWTRGKLAYKEYRQRTPIRYLCSKPREKGKTWSQLTITVLKPAEFNCQFLWPVRMLAWSCLTRCNPINSSPPGPPFHGIFQARILKWAAISYPRVSSNPGVEFTCASPALQADSLPLALPGKPTFDRRIS